MHNHFGFNLSGLDSGTKNNIYDSKGRKNEEWVRGSLNYLYSYVLIASCHL